MIEVSMRGSFQGEEENENDSRHEQKGVGLEVAGLHEAQGAAEDFRGTVQATNAETGNDPAIKPVSQSRNGFMRDSDEA
jgi:hypothetical protein